MSDHSDINLDSQLQDKSGLATKDRKFTGGYDFKSNYDRGAVTGYNLGNFSFNAGTGGTIVLTGGMTIKNAGGTTIIDSTGLNSENNFVFLKKNIGDGTVIGTTPTPLTNGTMGTIYAPRETNYFFQVSGYLWDQKVVETSDNPIAWSFLTLDVGTWANVMISLGLGYRIYNGAMTAVDTSAEYVSMSRGWNVPIGTHAVVVSLFSVSAGGSACCANVSSSYFSLGN
jgi:hypothetical protein